MTLKIIDAQYFMLTSPAATIHTGYPGRKPHLYPADMASTAGDSGATVDVEFTDDESPTPTAAV